jgi:hypothetical protein
MDGVPSSLEAKGFFKSLYDFKFDSLITLRLIRWLYRIIVIVDSIAAVIGFVVLMAMHNSVTIITALIAVPIGYVFSLIYWRVSLELVMVIFKIGADVRTIREGKEPAGSSRSVLPPPPI